MSEEEIKEGVRIGHFHKDLLTIINDFVEFCYLLREPTNHIKIASGNYIEKTVNVRTVQDMINEMTRELANLPRFHAYAKISDEVNGQQVTKTHQIETFPLPHLLNDNPNLKTYEYCKERDFIEKEIRTRQNKWLRRNDPTAVANAIRDLPPPTRF